MTTVGTDKIFYSLAPGRFQGNFGWEIFKLNLVTDGWVISCEIPLSWMSLDLIDDKAILLQVMAWCRQATSHYLNKCWPRSVSSYGVTRPKWVNSLINELWNIHDKHFKHNWPYYNIILLYWDFTVLEEAIPLFLQAHNKIMCSLDVCVPTCL